jgi:hypothetical protein
MSIDQLSEPTDTENTIPFEQFIYDNDVTLLYKWAEVFQLPISFIIVRPREPGDEQFISGTDKYVYESLQALVARLIENQTSPSEIYDYVHKYNKMIEVKDIAMVYYDIWKSQGETDLHIHLNNLYKLLGDSSESNMTEEDKESNAVYDDWIISKIYKNRKIDKQRLNTIQQVQNILLQQMEKPTLEFSPLILNTSIVGFSPTINGRKVVTQDGLDIFNKAIPSKYIPFIKYNDEYGKSYYRVYTGSKLENEPNYSVVVTPQSTSSHKNALYLTLWLGDPENDGSDDLNTAPKESFNTVIYELTNNFLTVKTPIFTEKDPDAIRKKGLITDPNIAYQRTKDALPNLLFGKGEEVKVGGEFNIWGLDFDETSFLDMVLNDSVMNVYLYVEENIRPFALKKRLDVHYRSIFVDQAEGKSNSDKPYIENSASVSITINEKIAEPGQIVQIYNMETGEKTDAKVPDEGEYKYVHINISQADSYAVLNEFVPVFRLLMGYYRDRKDDIMNLYYTYLPKLHQLESLLTDKKKKIQEQETTAEQLKKQTNRKLKRAHRKLYEKAPDIFVHGYPRICQSGLQPEPIEEEDIPQWKLDHPLVTGVERQVMPFPKNENRVFLGCPNDEAPYPGVKNNKNLSNKETYPYIPCCGKKDQINNKKSKYSDYLKSDARVLEVGAKAESKITTNRLLTPGKTGALPKAVENLLKKYSDSYIDMIRYGIIHSPNSLLHCICEAVNDENYLSLNTNADKEKYVVRLRNYIKNNVHPSLLRQELYDYGDESIIDALNDSDSFFDPSLYYRAIEEIFNVNLYVFLYPQSGDESELGTLEIPRAKIFHSRPIRLYRRTIVIIKTSGSKTDNLEYPQCELVIDYDKAKSQAVKIFGPEMTQICHETLVNLYKTITWTPTVKDTIQINYNMYYHIDHLNLFKYPIYSQFIDNNGKMRAITLNIDGKLLTVATVPSQPENITDTKEISRLPFNDVMSIFGEPMAVGENSEGNIDGLWYKILDIDYAEYFNIVPVSKDTVELSNYQYGPKNPIVSVSMSVTERLTKLRKTLNIITQLVKFLYELVRVPEGYDVKTFVDKYFVVDNDFKGDSSDYYNLENISRKLPSVQNIDKAIDLLSVVAPTLFADGKIVMYNIEFASRLIGVLEDYNNVNNGAPQKNIEYIDNYYESERSFDHNDVSKIFIGDDDLNAWLSSLKSSINYSKFFSIHKKIDINLSFIDDPYLYQDNDGKIYVIQNVVGGKKQKAINVAANWFYNKINMGPEAEPSEYAFPHIIYGISSSSGLTPIEDLSEDSEEYLKILYYGTVLDKKSGKENKYAAMLEIL